MKIYFSFLKLYHRAEKGLSKLTSFVLLVFFIQVVITVSFQIAYKEIFDAAGQRKDYHIVLSWIYVLLTACVLRILAGMLADYLVAHFTLRIFSNLRFKLFHHLQWLPAKFYQSISIGDLVSRYSHDLQQAEIATRQFLPYVIRSFMLGVLSIVILFYFQWQLALFAMCLFPFVIFGARIFATGATEATRRNQLFNAGLSSMIEEVTTQHILVQSFNLQESFSRRFQKKIKDYKDDFIRGIFLRGLVSRSSIFGLSISEILVFSVGAIMTYRGMMSPGTLFGFFALIWNLSGAVDAISQYLPNFIEAGGSMERIQALLNEKIETPGHSKKIQHNAPPIFNKTIRFDNVFLNFSDKKPVLCGINLEIQAGQSIAFVGPTGSGKSTLLSLLMGFHYPTSGTLTIDGKDIKNIPQPQLRAEIGIVLQHNPLFNTSLRDNIRMGRRSASDLEVEEAAKAAEIHDFIMTLPQGYDTPVLEYGSNLSGGQKQRLAIARVYLRSPSLILLDEPTSALDLVVEAQINALIAKLAREKTVILATHRLSTLRDIDCIYVVDKGQILESGSHTALLKNKGLYHQLWHKQHGVALEAANGKSKIGIGFLQTIPLLHDLPEDMLFKIADEFLVEWVDGGQIVFNKGSYGDQFYIIARGTVEVHNPDLKPENSLLATLEEGDYFGEIALLRECMRTAQIKTSAHCVFLSLHSSQFLAIIGAVPHLRERLEAKLRERQPTL